MQYQFHPFAFPSFHFHGIVESLPPVQTTMCPFPDAKTVQWYAQYCRNCQTSMGDLGDTEKQVH